MAKIELSLKTLADVAVVTPGTPVPLSAVPFVVMQASIQWNPNNAGDVYIGESDVTATKGLVLNSGTPVLDMEAEDSAADEDSVGIDLNKIFIDAATGGDSVKIAYTEFTTIAYNS